MHGDHCTDVPHLREKWGAKVWTLDSIVDKFEHPTHFDYIALIESYGVGVDSFKVDRAFRPGETLNWEGYTFIIDHMPGQTDFALCVWGMIDGQRVAFTGDNIFGNPRDPKQNGHEAVCARNQAIPDEGYIVGAEYLTRLKPDLLMGGHSWVMDRPAEMIERYRKWSYDLRDALIALSSEADYRYGFDPYWVHAEPYRAILARGASVEVRISVRNFHATPRPHRIELHLPEGLQADPPVLEVTVPGNATQKFPVRLYAKNDATPGVAIVALDASVGGHRYGELFDMMVDVK
jgi:glyoxylase-like metal-dependent hydrolase (beta-lactamase superfamily II)